MMQYKINDDYLFLEPGNYICLAAIRISIFIINIYLQKEK